MNLGKPIRNMSSTHTTAAAPGSANYSGIGALIGTLTGLALAVNKHKVPTYLLSLVVENSKKVICEHIVALKLSCVSIEQLLFLKPEWVGLMGY